MALTDKGFSEELTIVAKTDDGNPELGEIVELIRYLGFVVEGLGGV